MLFYGFFLFLIKLTVLINDSYKKVAYPMIRCWLSVLVRRFPFVVCFSTHAEQFEFASVKLIDQPASIFPPAQQKTPNGKRALS